MLSVSKVEKRLRYYIFETETDLTGKAKDALQRWHSNSLEHANTKVAGSNIAAVFIYIQISVRICPTWSKFCERDCVLNEILMIITIGDNTQSMSAVNKNWCVHMRQPSDIIGFYLGYVSLKLLLLFNNLYALTLN